MELRRLRVRERMFGPACYGGGYGWHHHHYWGPYPPPPPWWGERPTPEEQAELKEHIEMLKEEIAAAEKRLQELSKDK